MNLPEGVDDPSLLEHEPLCSHIIMYECARGQRSVGKQTISEFVKEMKRDVHAATAAKRWATFVFEGALSDESTFTLSDGGDALYDAFFKYQYELYKGRKQGNMDEAMKKHANLYRLGPTVIKAVNLKAGHDAACDQRSARGSGSGAGSNGQDNQRALRASSRKKANHQAEIRVNQLDAGNTATHPNSKHGTRPSKKVGPVIQQGSPFATPSATDAQLPAASEVATLSECSSVASKKGKRKASSQKPPFIALSDVSEDDRESPNAHAVTIANSISHHSKRTVPNPRQPSVPSVVNNRADKQHAQDAVSISQPQSSMTTSQSDVFTSRSGVQGRRDAALPHSGRMRHSERLSKVSTLLIQANFNTRRSQKKTLVGDPQPPANKRRRQASMSTRENGPGVEPEPLHDSLTVLAQESTIQRPIPVAISPPVARENAKRKVQGKRTRLEFETPFVVSDQTVSANSHEFLGPDKRLLRPLPRKVRNVCSAPVARGAPSLQHVDQLLRDVASNALAVLREPVGPNVPDWTQDKECEAEYDAIGGDNPEEGNQDGEVRAPPLAVTPAPPRPPVPARPRLWAQSRQEVCESFEYFRCYHGGVYFKDDIVKGYLLGAYAANRDVFRHGGKLIISHGGGKSESIIDVRGAPRRYQLDQDQQATDISVRALLRTCKERRPIVLLADDKYALFPYDLASDNYTYVVLGMYWISHAWAECQPARDGSGRIVRWKFAFQWCEGQGEPWWLPREGASGSTFDKPLFILNSGMNPSGGSSIQCKHCQELSPFVYVQGWMCLNPRCSSFWSIDGEEPKQLDYREEFLQLLPQKFERLPNIIPTRVINTSSGITTTYIYSRGWHCVECGRMSCRFKWEHWECSNCKRQYVVNGRIRTPKEFWHQRPPKGFMHSQVGKETGISTSRVELIDLGLNRGFTSRLTFTLPLGRGQIHLILGTPLSNGEADEIFQLYQQQATTGELKLRRYPLRNRYSNLTVSLIQLNMAGEPYQYVGGSGQTVPFCDAPECVRRALGLIKERASLSLRTNVPFNEILTAAYMERQKMAFHSDSEKELGPTVASLSLGSAALMHFRAHAKADSPKGKGASHVLTLVLRHGDVLIMDGSGVQNYYEHTVVPMNFRIAATARCIGTV